STCGVHALAYLYERACLCYLSLPFFFIIATSSSETYSLSLHDALPICSRLNSSPAARNVFNSSGVMSFGRYRFTKATTSMLMLRSEEHTSELQSLRHLVCRLLLEKKKQKQQYRILAQQLVQ